ncbi:MAG: hypothetical protein AAF891_00120 [Pseudomonadota bacterium]
MNMWQSFLDGFTRRYPDAARGMTRRWAKAFRDDPDLAHDLIALGGIIQLPAALVPGEADLGPVDPIRLAFEAGQRDLAMRILALGKINPRDLGEILEQNNV